MTNEQIAYLAGIIDGEGCIRVVEEKAKYSRGSVNPRFRMLLQITNTNLGLLEWLKINWGGYIVIKEKYQAKDGITRKKCFHARWYDKKAGNILRQCMPYFIAKKKEALVCLELDDMKKGSVHKKGTMGSIPFSQKEIERRRNLAIRLSALKKA